MSDYHIPVMLKEVLEYLDVKPGRWYVDCNLGGGGHAAGILKAGGKVIGIDLDPDAIREVAKNNNLTIQQFNNGLRAYSDNLILVQGNFADLNVILNEVKDLKTKHSLPPIGGKFESRVSSVIPQNDKTEIASSSLDKLGAPRNDGDGWLKIAGVLYDLGVSSYQLETPERGFSFNQDAPLDMRMDTSKESATAADLINGLHEGELAELFLKLGEENFAKPIARAISGKRKAGRITTTNQLAQIILSVRKRSKNDRTHPATRVFQALRIAVNDELNSLRESLPQAWEILDPGGRLVVISFHSLEDRIVKEFCKRQAESGNPSTSSGPWGKIVTKKPLEPSEKEVLENPRARSAKLRVLKKLLDTK